jgi:hypothetical protein
MDTHSILLITFSSFTALGLLCYLHIYWHNRETLQNNSLRNAFMAVFSHVDRTDAGPFPHMFACLFTLFGIAGLLSLLIVNVENENSFNFGLTLSTFSVVTVAFFIVLEVWTLWQARRLAFNQGYEVIEFKELTRLIGDALQRQRKSITQHYKGIPQSFHRVYVLAPEFYFGHMSFPDSEERVNIKMGYQEAFSRSRTSNLKLQIICGDKDLAGRFHKEYFGDGAEDSVRRADDTFEEFLETIPRANLKRANKLPPMQFIIIDNTLFEFSLASNNNHSEVFNTQVISDSKTLNIYIRQFEYFWEIVK